MRLEERSLAEIGKRGIKVPHYSRSTLKHSCVHIGLGHFHRSHFLRAIDNLLEEGLTESGVVEVDFMPPASYVEDLKAQDYLYTLTELSADGCEDVRVIGAIVGYANQISEPEKVFSLLTSPETVLISLTITEKGYCYSAESDSLDFSNPAIRHDLESEGPCSSVVGALSAALEERRIHNLPVTIMSCDNVPGNGEMLKKCILQFSARKYPSLSDWILSNVSFPSTMVDRITPGTTLEDIEKLKNKWGVEDGAPVHSEDFFQWVIEADFRTAIPPFDKAGAMFVEDVKSYEFMKIRLLNGAHSALSYPSLMLGHTMVHEAMEDGIVRYFIRNCYMEEISKTLPAVPGVDLEAYKDKLISRFSNRNIADTLLRLASDGSKKIANAIVKPLLEADVASRSALLLSLVLWEYYCQNPDAVIEDPKESELRAAAGCVADFFHLAGINDEGMIAQAEELLAKVRRDGVGSTLRACTP